MASVLYLPSALEALDRLVEFLQESDPTAAIATAAPILDSLRLLADHPLIGRPAGVDRRELVIFRGRNGYLAQYRYDALSDQVAVVSVRHQRETDL